jgi:uncharacterized protein YcaQ
MKPVVLSLTEAQKIILHAAGLSKRGQLGKGIEGVYQVIDHLGHVQIDTNYVVERAHHHVMHARIPGYQPDWLNELQEDDRIFEYFTYASGYMPMEDYRFTLPLKAYFLDKYKDSPAAELRVMNKVLNTISRDGAMMARDFENDRVGPNTGWWDWRPSKVALERLYLQGALMTTHRRDFQKVFDLPINRVPTDTDRTMPSSQEYARYVIHRALSVFGIAYAKDIIWRTRYLKDHIKGELAKMVSEGLVCEATVEGMKGQTLYMLPSYRSKKISLTGDAFILSPFDPLNVLRHRLKDFFGFDYQVECFVPEAKRKYGYFALPILIGDTFVARMDAKVDRKQKVLNVLNLHFESIKPSTADTEKLRYSLLAFATFNQCTSVLLHHTNKKTLAKAVMP